MFDDTHPHRQTDRQTDIDKQTDTHAIAITCTLSVADCKPAELKCHPAIGLTTSAVTYVTYTDAK